MTGGWKSLFKQLNVKITSIEKRSRTWYEHFCWNESHQRNHSLSTFIEETWVLSESQFITLFYPIVKTNHDSVYLVIQKFQSSAVKYYKYYEFELNISHEQFMFEIFPSLFYYYFLFFAFSGIVSKMDSITSDFENWGPYLMKQFQQMYDKGERCDLEISCNKQIFLVKIFTRHDHSIVSLELKFSDEFL